MSTAIALFVKTPGLSPIKTRLAASISESSAIELYKLCVEAVKETVTASSITAYWAVAEESAVHSSYWKDFTTLHTGEGELGKRQSHIYNTLIEKFDRVLLIGADTPQLTVELLNETTQKLREYDFVIGPALDGGYYLFGGSKPIAESIWTAVTYSEANTRKNLENKLSGTIFHLPTLCDIDTVESFSRVIKEMPRKPTDSQHAVIKWIEDTYATL